MNSSLQLKTFIRKSHTLMDMAKLVLWFRRLGFIIVRRKVLRRYLSIHDVAKLQIGSGPNIIEGWLNTDLSPRSKGVLFLDARKYFCFDNDVFDYIFSEHQIEQLTYSQGLTMLSECFRVLKPGGRIRIATTSMDALISLTLSPENHLQSEYIKWITKHYLPQIDINEPAFVINNAFYNWDHQFIYDHRTLKTTLQIVGFVDIEQCLSQQSDREALRDIECHGSAVDNEEMSRFETMVIEGSKPKLNDL